MSEKIYTIVAQIDHDAAPQAYYGTAQEINDIMKEEAISWKDVNDDVYIFEGTAMNADIARNEIASKGTTS